MKRVLAICFSVTFICLLFNNHAWASKSELPIVSDSVILMDTNSNAVLYAKNEHKQMYPASLTKIATAIYAIEKGNISDNVIVPPQALEVEGTKVYLNEGEVVSLNKLIQGMLINSGNDAAMAIAINLDGSIEQFSKNINQYLRETVGIRDTNFTNPHGLFEENHYTTAYDLAILTNYAKRNKVFNEIFGTKQLKWDGQSWDTTLFTHHLLLKGEIPFNGITGGKTGFVNESLQTLATSATNDELNLTAICLKASLKRDIYNDTLNLLTYGFSQYQSRILPKDLSLVSKNGDKYTLKEPIYITESIFGGDISVTSDGNLITKDQNSHEIQSISVKDSLDEPEEMKLSRSEEKQVKPDRTLSNMFISVIGVSIIALTLSLRRKILGK